MLHDPAKQVAKLLRDHADKPAQDFLQSALAQLGPVAMVSSFGADSAVLLHMLARIDRAIPVLFIDTLALFPETLAYQHALAQHLGLCNVQIITPERTELFKRDPEALLHRADPESCCQLRKAEPLARALQGYAGWITGRKRHQAATRTLLERVISRALPMGAASPLRGNYGWRAAIGNRWAIKASFKVKGFESWF